MKLFSKTFPDGGLIPARCGYGRIGAAGETVSSENLSPQLAWDEVPAGTKSFVIACLDDDVPTDVSERDASGELPATQLRRRFVHWVQVDVDAGVRSVPEGAFRHGTVVPATLGREGINDYSRGGVPAAGECGTGWDGPCPPFFDARPHTYRFFVLALDVERLEGLPVRFRWEDVERLSRGHVLAGAELDGRYTLNPRLAAMLF